MSTQTDWRDDLVKSQRLEAAYSRAVANGDLEGAAALARQIDAFRQTPPADVRRLNAASAYIEATAPRPPEKGELERLATRRGKLERSYAEASRRFTVQQRQCASMEPSEAALEQLRAAKQALDNVGLELEAVQARELEIERWSEEAAGEKKRRAEAARLAREQAAARRRESERRAKLAPVREGWAMIAAAAAKLGAGHAGFTFASEELPAGTCVMKVYDHTVRSDTWRLVVPIPREDAATQPPTEPRSAPEGSRR